RGYGGRPPARVRRAYPAASASVRDRKPEALRASFRQRGLQLAVARPLGFHARRRRRALVLAARHCRAQRVDLLARVGDQLGLRRRQRLAVALDFGGVRELVRQRLFLAAQTDAGGFDLLVEQLELL